MRVSTACKQRASEIVKRAPQGGLVVEVGVLVGHMSAATMKQRPDLRWAMVDNWLAQEDQPQHYVETKDDHALHTQEQADRNKARAMAVAKAYRAEVFNMDSQAAAAVWPEGLRPDLVFIDADHSYEGCHRDIIAWLKVVKPGGWIGGHDYGNPDPRFGGVDRAVKDIFKSNLEAVEVGANYTWWVRV